MRKIKIGTITHYYDKIEVAIIKLGKPLKQGQKIEFKDKQGETVFTQVADSIEIERKTVDKAKKDDDVGLKVDQPVKPGWEVYSS